MGFALQKSRPALAGLLAALAVEFADELVDGTKSAAIPLIKHDLVLTYFEVGLLTAVPLLLGSLIELPVGVLSGTGRRRRRFVLTGGLVFIASVLAAGLAGSFPVLLAALVIFFPASGAFVSLTQSALMDAYPDRRAQHMARWTLAGAVGSVAGPVLVAAVVAAGGSWRVAFVLVAVAAGVSWLGIAATSRAAEPVAGDEDADEPVGSWPGLRAALRITLAAGAVRWLLLLETSDLLLDVFTGFLALYLVVSVHASPLVAAIGVAVRLGAGLAGYAALTPVLERFSPLRVLRVSVLVSGVLFPVFLLVPGIAPKLIAARGPEHRDRAVVPGADGRAVFQPARPQRPGRLAQQRGRRSPGRQVRWWSGCSAESRTDLRPWRCCAWCRSIDAGRAARPAARQPSGDSAKLGSRD